MAHVHDPIIQPSRADIATRAREIHLGPLLSRTALTTVLFLLASAGWVAGTAWFLVVFTAMWSFNRVKWAGQAVRYGYCKGAHLTVTPKESRA